MKFHHIGFVVRSIEEYEKNMLFEKKIHDVIDPIQNARLSIYKNFNESYIELIEPLNESSFTYNFLTKNHGNPFHHLCYEVKDETEMEVVSKSFHLLKFKGPLKAALFNDKVVFFFLNRNKSIVEFLINE